MSDKDKKIRERILKKCMRDTDKEVAALLGNLQVHAVVHNPKIKTVKTKKPAFCEPNTLTDIK